MLIDDIEIGKVYEVWHPLDRWIWVRVLGLPKSPTTGRRTIEAIATRGERETYIFRSASSFDHEVRI
jgi:hypothetical protein